VLTVTGRASHAGNAPDQGRNALYELSHQVLQLRDLSEPARSVKLNWTLANAGSVYNSIPAAAMAIGDMRADDPNDFKTRDSSWISLPARQARLRLPLVDRRTHHWASADVWRCARRRKVSSERAFPDVKRDVLCDELGWEAGIRTPITLRTNSARIVDVGPCTLLCHRCTSM
jgi:Peptidase dimerisation domain